MKTSFAKKLLAILLSFLVAVGVATPAFAMEMEDDRLSMANLVDDNIAGNIEDDSRQVFEMLSYLMQRVNDNDKKAKEYAESWIGIANSYFNPTIGAIKGISSVISLINGTIILLQNLGIIESETDKTQSILDGINSIQLSVNEINKNVDKIQETLVSEFSEIDMKFQEQEYNHYKNEVWAQFYSNSVLPLLNYQNEYNDDVRWLLVNYVEQWQGADGDCPTDLRALYGKDDDGNYIQVYSGKNFGDVGEKLPREPKASVDSAPVEYSVTLPSEYISKNLDELTAISTDNCVDKLIEALEKGVYEAAQDRKLSAYGGFDTEWSYLSETEKREKAKQFAADLADSLAFACAYNAANERRFASNVKSAYENYTKWINGEESLTSPTFAQLKMLALTHGFEGEIRDQAETVITYLMLMNVNFGTFTQTVVSLSKAHGEDDTEDIQTQWASSESSIIRDYTTFLTGNPNYCYQLGKSIEYKNIAITSDFNFTYGTMYNERHDLLEVYEEYFSSNSWVLSERDAVYSPYKEEELQQRISSGEDLKKRSVSAKDAKLIYTMYQSSGIKGTFADYLAANCVTPDVGIIGNQMITSFSTSNFDLGSGVSMKCYLPVNADSYRFNDGQTYAVNTETSGECDDSGCFLVHDQATGGLFNMNDGTFDENARLAARAFYGESNTFSTDEMYVFSSTNCNNSKVRLSKSEVEDRGIVYYDDHEGYFDVVSEFSTEYGMLVSSEQNSYTFPENTKNVPDRFFGSDMLIRKVIFKGIPETIGDNAFSGVGTKNNRCLLIVPEGFDTGSLIGKWHGGYFGDAQIILKKNDGTNEEKTAVAVKGASISTVINPFAAPEGKLFKGWSLSETSNIVLSDKEIVTPGKTLYAVWEYDHEHDFEVASEYVAPTCTQNGSTAERTCKICEYKEESQPIPAFGHSCKFTKNDSGTYFAECTECGYSAVLYPTTAGDYTVWCEDWKLFAVEYTVTALYVGCMTIKESGVYVIENTDKSTVSNHRIKVTDVDPLSKVVINGTVFPYTDHNGENKLYIYLRLFETADNIPQLVIEESDRGTVTSNPVSPKEGDEVTLSAVANDGYAFKGFEIIPEVEIKDNSFVMPDFGVKVKANFARIGKITVKDCENCTVTPSKSVAASGERITLRIVPDTGMELSRWDVTAGNVTVTNNSFIMPEEDVVISGICTPVLYKLTWDVMGYTTTTYLPFGAVIDKHASPEREGYTFDGWTPEVAETMPAENVTYKAVLTPITYYATFVADGKTIATVPYTMEDKSIEEPSIPYKTGYASSWGDYKLDVGGVTVTAEYDPETYIAKFVADGKVIDELPYTVETDYIEEPAIPEKDGYTARWSGYTFHAGGITVNAVYTALTHEHTFNTEYSKNEYSHWYAATCEHTELVKGMQLHSFVKDEDGDGEITYTCSVCGYKKGEDESVKQLAEAQSALDAANKALEEKSAALKTAEETLNKAADDLAATQDALKDKTDALNTAEEKLAAANTSLKDAELQISELTSELGNANKELTEAKAALDTANASLETAKTEKADLESQLAKKTAELEELKESAHAEDEKIKELENSISDLNAAVNAKNVEIAAKSDNIAALESDISKLENEITSLKNEAAEKNKQIENLSKELEKSKAEIEELKNGSGEQEDEPCPECGKVHKDNFFGKIACFFNRIGNFFRDLFQKIF